MDRKIETALENLRLSVEGKEQGVNRVKTVIGYDPHGQPIERDTIRRAHSAVMPEEIIAVCESIPAEKRDHTVRALWLGSTRARKERAVFVQSDDVRHLLEQVKPHANRPNASPPAVASGSKN